MRQNGKQSVKHRLCQPPLPASHSPVCLCQGRYAADTGKEREAKQDDNWLNNQLGKNGLIFSLIYTRCTFLLSFSLFFSDKLCS